MAVAQAVKPSSSTDIDRETVKQTLLNEVKLRLELEVAGIRFTISDFEAFRSSSRRNPRANRDFPGNRIGGFALPHGISGHGRYNKWSRFSLVVEDGEPVLYDDETRIGAVTFHETHPIYEQSISTGEAFGDIASVNAEGGMRVAYSNECSLKDLGEDCLYCGVNVRHKEGRADAVFLKSPRQIAEVYDLGRKLDTANHLNVTGGFVPERRELDNYVDVVEAIHDIGYPDANIVTVIGAPSDLSIIDKYKEAGVSIIDIHIEIWDKDIFKAICPGKEKRNGGWKHWVEALEYSVSVFGKGKVHSNLVAGLEPKNTALEGIEYLASKGVVCNFGAFFAIPGTPLEGQQTPEASWHWDMVTKAADIYRRYGFSTNDVYGGSAPGRPVFDVFRINEGEFVGNKLPQWRFPSLG